MYNGRLHTQQHDPQINPRTTLELGHVSDVQRLPRASCLEAFLFCCRRRRLPVAEGWQDPKSCTDLSPITRSNAWTLVSRCAKPSWRSWDYKLRPGVCGDTFGGRGIQYLRGKLAYPSGVVFLFLACSSTTWPYCLYVKDAQRMNT